MDDYALTKTDEIERLIAALPTTREYDRPYEQLVEDVRAGRVRIFPGGLSPVLMDDATGRLIKGTGKGPLTHDKRAASHTTAAELWSHAPEVLEKFMKRLLSDDAPPRLFEIWFKYTNLDPSNNRGVDPKSVLDLLQAQGERRNERVIDID